MNSVVWKYRVWKVEFEDCVARYSLKKGLTKPQFRLIFGIPYGRKITPILDRRMKDNGKET